MKCLPLIALLFAFGCSSPRESGRVGTKNVTDVKFTTTDSTLQKTYNRAEFLAKENIVEFDGRKVMIEGAQYTNLWLETQPMGGSMYAKRNLEIARNNIEVFIDYQREDGRFPGVI